jgi:hypothetical protein
LAAGAWIRMVSAQCIGPSYGALFCDGPHLEAAARAAGTSGADG